eukprot:187966-Pelagomonas_calceolata.AAC.1
MVAELDARSQIYISKYGGSDFKVHSHQGYWIFGSRHTHISGSSIEGSCKLKASFHDEWRGPLLNNHRVKMDVILNLVKIEGSPPVLFNYRAISPAKEKSMPAKTPRALRKGFLTSKLERVSPKGPQT